MGWKTLLVNAVRGNRDMLRIYESLGFRYIDGIPNAPTLSKETRTSSTCNVISNAPGWLLRSSELQSLRTANRALKVPMRFRTFPTERLQSLPM